jgi:hypothetical protein
MKLFSSIFIAIGILLIFGTAGASDLEQISLVQMIARITFSIILIGVGVTLRKLPQIYKTVCRGKRKAAKGIAFMICACVSEKSLLRMEKMR